MGVHFRAARGMTLIGRARCRAGRGFLAFFAFLATAVSPTAGSRFIALPGSIPVLAVLGSRIGSLFAVGDIPAAPLEVDGGWANPTLDMAPLAVGAGGRAAVRERLDLFEVVTTVQASKFVDGHMTLQNDIISEPQT